MACYLQIEKRTGLNRRKISENFHLPERRSGTDRRESLQDDCQPPEKDPHVCRPPFEDYSGRGESSVPSIRAQA